MTAERKCEVCGNPIDDDGVTTSYCYGDGSQCHECFACYCDGSC